MSEWGRAQDALADMWERDLGYAGAEPGPAQELGLTYEQWRGLSDEVMRRLPMILGVKATTRAAKAEADLAALRAAVADVIARCEDRLVELQHPLRNSIDVGEVVGIETVAVWLREATDARE